MCLNSGAASLVLKGKKSGQSHSVISVTCSSRLYGCCLVTELKLNAPWLLNMCTISCLDELKHDTQALDTSSLVGATICLKNTSRLKYGFWRMDSGTDRTEMDPPAGAFVSLGWNGMDVFVGRIWRSLQNGSASWCRGPTDTHAHVLMSSIFIYNLWVDQI